MRSRLPAVIAAVLVLVAGCGAKPGVSTTQPPAPVVGARDCQDVQGVLDRYNSRFVAVQGEIREAVKRGDRKAEAEGLQKADQLVTEWAGLVEGQVAEVGPGDLHDALVSLLDQVRQYTPSKGMNGGDVAKAVDRVRTALGQACT